MMPSSLLNTKHNIEEPMILIQSYSSPTVMSADYGVYEVLKEHYLNMRTLFYKTPNVVDCRIRKILSMALRSNFVSHRGETILNWGAQAYMLGL